MFTKILVPVDLNDSKLAKAALEKAVTLAKTSGAELRLLYVMPVVPSTYLEYVPVNFEAGEKTRVEQELENLVQLRHQLEQRLQADLAYWTYRFRRVLA